jgi:hypothetical protein
MAAPAILPVCALHKRPLQVYDRACKRLLCGDLCPLLPEHQNCRESTITLSREKAERLDTDLATLKSRCEQLNVVQTLQKLTSFVPVCDRMLQSIEQDKDFTMDRLQSNYSKVLLCHLMSNNILELNDDHNVVCLNE